MREWLVAITQYAILAIDAMALVLIVVGTVETFILGLKTMLGSADGHAKRVVWLRFARWLVAALTFQLAADVLETMFNDDWNSIGRIAAVAVIRTFLNYFLERDLADVRERQKETVALTG